MTDYQRTASRFGAAWLVLCLCFALHVTEEALTGFLRIYNLTVRTIRERLPFLPFPTFTLRVWLTTLVVAVVVLLTLSIFAFRGAAWMSLLAYPYGLIMLLNGLGHLAGSLYLRRIMPGAYSAPFLVAASVYLLVAAWKLRSSPQSALGGSALP
jgi:hypothetical protein